METLPTAETARRKAPPPAVARESKSLAAYRTITEVAADIGVATHVLRFWETKFTQIKPLKKSGGRRYYNADTIAIVRLIQNMLYDQGMTIRGVQTQLKKTTKTELREAARQQTLSPQAVLNELKEIRALLAKDTTS